MDIIFEKNKEQGSIKAAEMMIDALESGAKVFGLATGSTPEIVYDQLIASDADFSNAVSVNLDEYVGLAGDHEQSYQYFMDKKLFDHKPFKATYVPNGINEEEAEIERYEQILAENPVDLQLLGIGQNGHIAFNEPGTPFDSVTHKVELTDSTIQANKRNFEKEEDVPRYAYSMGLSSIMQAKKIILLAFGEEKAEAIRDLVTAKVATEAIPSTILINHPDVTIIVDEAAAKLIK